MSRTVYVNGNFVEESQALVSVFDRGFLMSDGVYEVTSVLNGKLLDFEYHCNRLDRSLTELEMVNPLSRNQWLELHRQLIQRNALDEGLVYLQVTRGNPGDRDFLYPTVATHPTVVMFTQNKPGMADASAARVGWRVVCIPDLRWGRRDIKTIQLLYPSMAKMLARKAGADDAWFVQDGFVTEGTSNNAYIIKDNCIITCPTGHDILHGVTRRTVLRIAAQAGLGVEQRSFTVAEAQRADEAFVTSASAFVMPVVAIDDHPVRDGRPGEHATRLRSLYLQHVRTT